VTITEPKEPDGRGMAVVDEVLVGLAEVLVDDDLLDEHAAKRINRENVAARPARAGRSMIH
jgi:hypothetical protein